VALVLTLVPPLLPQSSPPPPPQPHLLCCCCCCCYYSTSCVRAPRTLRPRERRIVEQLPRSHKAARLRFASSVTLDLRSAAPRSGAACPPTEPSPTGAVPYRASSSCCCSPAVPQHRVLRLARSSPAALLRPPSLLPRPTAQPRSRAARSLAFFRSAQLWAARLLALLCCAVLSRSPVFRVCKNDQNDLLMASRPTTPSGSRPAGARHARTQAGRMDSRRAAPEPPTLSGCVVAREKARENARSVAAPSV
jgi:hypothetical protein